MSDIEIKELQEIATFQDVVFADFPNAETLVAEVNRFESILSNGRAIVERNLVHAYASRPRSKDVLTKVCDSVGVDLQNILKSGGERFKFSYEFTSDPTLAAIFEDNVEALATLCDKSPPEGKKVKIKIFGQDAEVDFLSFAALTGSSNSYNTILRYNLKPALITLVCAVISGHSELINDIFNTLSNPPIGALVRIALLAFQKDVFSWLLDKYVLPSDELQNLLLFIAKTVPLPDKSFDPPANIAKIPFTFNYVFESDNIPAITACVARGYVPGSNLSDAVGPMHQYVKQWVIALLEEKIKSGSEHRNEVVLGNMYRLTAINQGPFFEFYPDELRILVFDQRPRDRPRNSSAYQPVDEPQLGNDYDRVPANALELFKRAADSGDKAGKQMYDFYRQFGPPEFTPTKEESEQFKFDESFEKQVFGIERGGQYFSHDINLLDEKFYNVPKFLQVLEDSYVKIPDNGTAEWRDFNFVYGSALYVGLVPGRKQEGADRLIKFALYGLSFERTNTLLLYAENDPASFPADKVNLDYVRKLRDALRFAFKSGCHNLEYFLGDRKVPK